HARNVHLLEETARSPVFPCMWGQMASAGTAITAAGTEANGMTNTVLGPIGQKAFEGRGIDVETVVRFGVYTGRSVTEADGTSKVVPDESGNVIVFPFIEGGSVVAEKYRAPQKRFWQRAGGRKTFWN